MLAKHSSSVFNLSPRIRWVEINYGKRLGILTVYCIPMLVRVRVYFLYYFSLLYVKKNIDFEVTALHKSTSGEKKDETLLLFVYLLLAQWK